MSFPLIESAVLASPASHESELHRTGFRIDVVLCEGYQLKRNSDVGRFLWTLSGSSYKEWAMFLLEKFVLDSVADEFGVGVYFYFFEYSYSISADSLVAKREKLGNLTHGFSQRN